MIIKLLVWLLVPVANAYLDRKGPKRDYLKVNGIRAMFAIAHGILVLGKNTYDNYAGMSAVELWNFISPMFYYQVASYWIVFELTLNLLRNNKLLYYDMVEKDSGWVDRLFAVMGPKAGPPIHALAKLLALLTAIQSTIILCRW